MSDEDLPVVDAPDVYLVPISAETLSEWRALARYAKMYAENENNEAMAAAAEDLRTRLQEERFLEGLTGRYFGQYLVVKDLAQRDGGVDAAQKYEYLSNLFRDAADHAVDEEQ